MIAIKTFNASDWLCDRIQYRFRVFKIHKG
jgi:hypothetical protein